MLQPRRLGQALHLETRGDRDPRAQQRRAALRVDIYYRQDSEKVPPPGIIVIGKTASRVGALDVPGLVRVTLERLE